MTMLLLGLVIFLGMHATRIFAPGWRDARIARWGPGAWKGLVSVLSLSGLLLIIWGYGHARESPVWLWTPPPALRHAVGLFTLPAFILLVAAYVPHNHFKSRLGHPMALGVMLWAFGHLLANGQLHAVVLFGSFLLWSILSFRAARRREPPTRAPASTVRTLLAVVVGTALWAAFAFDLHARWIGVAPFG